MKVTYLYHSGFLVEWEHCCFLFDYIKGDLPQAAFEKPLFVFVSHSHRDHFLPEIFRMLGEKEDVRFVLAKQIPMGAGRRKNLGLTPGQEETLVRMGAGQKQTLPDGAGGEMEITTLSSTDMGVAFLVRYVGKTVYHAGDLNDWQWKGEDPAWNKGMRARYLRQMELLKGVEIDLAFVPLDPRQEEFAPCGLNALLESAEVKAVLPMHMWGKYEIGGWWKKEGGLPAQAHKLAEIETEGQQFEF